MDRQEVCRVRRCTSILVLRKLRKTSCIARTLFFIIPYKMKSHVSTISPLTCSFHTNTLGQGLKETHILPGGMVLVIGRRLILPRPRRAGLAK